MRLEATNIRFQHATAEAFLFTDAELSVSAGQIVSIMGPSGSGKSTFLDLLAGQIRPQSGSVWLSEDGDRREPKVRDIAWVFQSTPVLSGRSALDNVTIAGLAAAQSRKAAEEVALESLATVGLADKSLALVGELSGGEVQRVTIARSLASSAPVVLADEPSAQLDPRLAAQIAGALKAVARKGKIVVVATHDPAVDSICDRRYNIEAGRLVRSAPQGNLKSDATS